MLSEFWRSETPDLVVSVVPNFNRALFQGLRRVPSYLRSSQSLPTSLIILRTSGLSARSSI